MLASARGHGKIGLSNLLVRIGEVVEWLMAPVLKTGEVKASVGSNPTLSVCPWNAHRFQTPAHALVREAGRGLCGSSPI